GLDQGGGIDGGADVEQARVDGGLHAAEIDLVEFARKRGVLETALGQAAMERHLAALETLDAHARARGLALAAAAAGLAHARADAAPDAGPLLAGARPVSEFVEFHDNVLVFFSSPACGGGRVGALSTDSTRGERGPHPLRCARD